MLRQCIEPLHLSITDAATAGVTRHHALRARDVRLSKVFGDSAESWLVQQAQYDLAQVRADRIKVRRLEFA